MVRFGYLGRYMLTSSLLDRNDGELLVPILL
jgi:hypothetical protein